VDGTTEFPLMTEYPLISANELAGEAWAAMSRQDAAEALRLWAALREHSSERPDGFTWPVQILWENGRFDEAEAMAAEAFAQFPDDPELFVQYAWIASMAQRWDVAAQRWAAVRARAPGRVEGYASGARCLWQAGLTEEADAVVSAGLQRFPGDIQLMAESGWIATARPDWDEALRRWTQVREADPERLDAQVRMIQALRLLGRPDESEAMAAAALARHPDDIELLIEHVWIAAMREDWPEAAARLDRARRDEKNLPRVAQSLGAIEGRIGALSENPPVADAAAASDDGISASALMLAFESLGERCDFGAVQRHFGVEPLGLLRFAWSRLESLTAALADRFDAVGTVEDTGFDLYNGETIVRMKKYEMIFHTFLRDVAEQPPEKQEALHQQQRRRLMFLKDKLISDLEEPQKIWVYSTERYASDADVARLFAALRAYGPNSLLYVRPASAGHPAGSLEVLEDGLYAGYFPGLANFVNGGQPPFELWRQLCARTYQLAKTGDPGNSFIKSLL
jgi:tetratricopeptide (TPR) repeat protein